MSFIQTDGVIAVACDRPGCEARVLGVGVTSRQQKRDAVDLAERKGWQLSPHGVLTVDLCPVHLELTLPHRLSVTRLFTDDGRELPYKGGR